MTERGGAGDLATVAMTMRAEDLPRADSAALEPRLEAIYREHHGFVWSTLLRLGVPSAGVDDACQDVFLIVFRRLDDFEGRSQLRTWLFSIARRVAFRHRRGAQRAARKLDAFAAEPARTENLDDALEHRRAAMLVLHALDELDDDKRTAVVLHVFEGMSGPKISEMLGLPLDTAYSRIKAGRRVLRARLAALGVGDEARVLEEARRQTTASSTARRRVALLLAVRLTPTPVLAGVAWKGFAAAVVLGAAGLVGSNVIRNATTEVQSTSVVAVARPDLQRAAPPTRLPRAQPIAPVEVAAAPVLGVTQEKAPRRSPQLELTPERSERGLQEEVALIGAVKSALDRGRPADAMRRLDEHARLFSAGELSLERRGYRAIALCELGKSTQGRGVGRVFVKSRPTATLAGRVREACNLDGPSNSR